MRLCFFHVRSHSRFSYVLPEINAKDKDIQKMSDGKRHKLKTSSSSQDTLHFTHTDCKWCWFIMGTNYRSCFNKHNNSEKNLSINHRKSLTKVPVIFHPKMLSMNKEIIFCLKKMYFTFQHYSHIIQHTNSHYCNEKKKIEIKISF